jgi:methionine-rich copper-binding protein CopC
MNRVHFPGLGRSVTFLAAVAFSVALAAPAAVLGHAELDTITPPNGSTVTAAPAEIVATFTEALDPSKSSIVVLNSGGAQVATGATVDPADPKKMTLALPPLDAGTYQVRWTSASAQDGDHDRGTTGFTFAPAPAPSTSPSPSPSASAASPSPSTAAATVAPTPSGDGQPASTSTGDLIIPIVVAVILVAGLGYWLLRGRAGSGGTP